MNVVAVLDQWPAGGRSRVWAAVPVVFLVMLILGMGCVSDGARSDPKPRRQSGGGGGAAIERLHILLTPLVMKEDGRGGDPGVGVRLYGSNRQASQASPITRGKVELLMFEGVKQAGELVDEKPIRSWTFDSDKLRPLQHRTSIGTSYRFALSLGDLKRRVGQVTIVARYVPPKGQAVLSSPATLAIAGP